MMKSNYMRIFVNFVLSAVVLVLVGAIGYVVWYEWDRAQKIAHNEACEAATTHAVAESVEDAIPNLPCVYELVPLTLRELFFGAGEDSVVGSVMIRPCDPSATTSDCIREFPVPPPLIGGQPIDRYPYETEYPLLNSFYKVNDHLFIHNGLWTLQSESCAADMKTRGIVIDHTEVISRIFSLSLRNPDASWVRTLCDVVANLREHTTGARERTITNAVMVLETQDPIMFSGSDMDFPGTAYRVFIGAYEFIVSLGTGRIYTSSSFDGSLGEDIGGLWDEYINAEVGVMFSYPYTGGNQGRWGVASGETGRKWSATIGLPEYGASITLSAKTADYSAPKGGQVTPTEGFIEKDEAYYPLRRGVPKKTPFVPDDVWQSADGSPILVKIAKRDDYDFTADFPEPSIQAIMNLDGGAFAGIGVWFGKDGSVFPNAEDIEIFKRIVTSLRATY